MTLIYKIHVQCSSSYYKCYIFLITERIHVVMFYDILNNKIYLKKNKSTQYAYCKV